MVLTHGELSAWRGAMAEAFDAWCEDHMQDRDKFERVPDQLSPEGAAWVPHRKEMEAEIKAVNGANLRAGIEAGASAEACVALKMLKTSYKNVDSAKVQAALNKCNASNANKVTERFIQIVQKHGDQEEGHHQRFDV